MIKAAFPLDVKSPAARFEIPYGSIARPADGTEVPALRWIDVSDGSGQYGTALLNDSKYGFDVKGGVMRMSVVHGATYPDPEADRGRQELLYAIVPHRGDWRAAEVTRRGFEVNNPLITRVPLVHAGTLPKVHSFIKVGPANVILSALKKEMGYAEWGLVLRLYEIHGEKTEAKIESPLARSKPGGRPHRAAVGKDDRLGHVDHRPPRALRDQDDQGRTQVRRTTARGSSWRAGAGLLTRRIPCYDRGQDSPEEGSHDDVVPRSDVQFASLF